MKKQRKHINLSRITAFILSVAMLAGFCPQGVSFADIPITLPKVNAAENINNPRIVKDSSMDAGQKVTWDCVYFGSYPQSEVTSKDGSIYNALKNATGWDENNDITIGKTKYRRLKGEDATYYSSNEEGQYNWNGSYKTYHYFKYEPIKWRVLQSENGEAFLLSDVILDKQLYNENDKYVTWEKSSLRAWLNKKFIKRAFIDEEKEKINITEVVNKDNPVFGTKGGKNTSDKIFLLSLAEVSRKKGGKKYGLLDDEMKACENSDFSKKVSWWWLRSPGDDRYCAAVVNSDGWVYGDGSRVNGSDDGVRPALHLHLSSSNLFSYAGIVSSDGTENEVPYNTRTRLVQN